MEEINKIGYEVRGGLFLIKKVMDDLGEIADSGGMLASYRSYGKIPFLDIFIQTGSYSETHLKTKNPFEIDRTKVSLKSIPLRTFGFFGPYLGSRLEMDVEGLVPDKLVSIIDKYGFERV